MNMELKPIEKAVFEQVIHGFDESMDFLREMVRQPSVLGNERGVQQVVFKRLEQIGLKPKIWDLDLKVLSTHPCFGPLEITYNDRPNVTAVIPKAASGGRSLIFNGHIDVVSPGPLVNWVHMPYDATVEGEWMYGRGAADMKGGIAAMILAVEAVRAADIGLRGDVILESVIEEECTGNGTLACVLRGLKAEAAIVPESNGLQASHATVGSQYGLKFVREVKQAMY